AARLQDVSFYLCPSDISSKEFADNGEPSQGRSNYFGSIGITASTRDTNVARAGIFNVALDLSGTSETNPNYGNVRIRVKITDVTDGTSSTAMFSEITRATVTGPPGDFYNPTNTYILHNSDFDNLAPRLPACDNWDSSEVYTRITYRGLQYYRNLPSTSVYTHTVPPNYKGYDCGSDNFYAAHIAAPSYYSFR